MVTRHPMKCRGIPVRPYPSGYIWQKEPFQLSVMAASTAAADGEGGGKEGKQEGKHGIGLHSSTSQVNLSRF
jgi:hypothetical protein